jgi:uncharacterized protein YbaR (Trm112 family)
MQGKDNTSSTCPHCKKRMDFLEEASMGVTLKGKRSDDVQIYVCPLCKTFLGLVLNNQSDLQEIVEMLRNLPTE